MTSGFGNPLGATVNAISRIYAPNINIYAPFGTQFLITYSAFDRVNNKGTATRFVYINDTRPPVLALGGSPAVGLEYQPPSAATPYVDAGVTAFDSLDGDISGRVCVTVTNLNTTQSGGLSMVQSTTFSIGTVFKIAYSVTDAAGNSATSLVRFVTILDTTAPTVSLNGDVDVQLPFGIPFNDPWVTTVDAHDFNVAVTGSGVNMNPFKVGGGSYAFLYQATDQAKNTGNSVRRSVTYAPNTNPGNLLLVVLTLNISNRDFDTEKSVVESALSNILQGYIFIYSITDDGVPNSNVTVVTYGMRKLTPPYDWVEPLTQVSVLTNRKLITSTTPLFRVQASSTTPVKDISGASTSKASGQTTTVAIGVSVSLVVIICIVVAFFVIRNRRSLASASASGKSRRATKLTPDSRGPAWDRNSSFVVPLDGGNGGMFINGQGEALYENNEGLMQQPLYVNNKVAKGYIDVNSDQGKLCFVYSFTMYTFSPIPILTHSRTQTHTHACTHPRIYH